MRLATISAVLCLLWVSAHAVEPEEVLPDPALEARARQISQELRCVVCQSQSIDDSNAPLAKDLRLLVRERLAAGDSDRQVIDYVAARYGDYVLLKPRMAPNTLALWLAPAIAILIGGLIALLAIKRASNPSPAPASGSGQQDADEASG